VVAPGEPVNVVISYENNLTSEVTDAIIVARLAGFELDGTTVRSNDGFYRSSDGVVLWDRSTSRDKLALIRPGDKGTVSFSFVVPSGEKLKTNARLDISVNAAGKRLGETGVPQSLQAVTTQRITVASDFQLAAQGLYNANPFGVAGPMPPKSGQETRYAVVFTVTNTTNAVRGAKVTANMPAYVRWTGVFSPSSEKMYFKGSSQNVPADSPCRGFTEDICWAIGEVAPRVGIGGVEPRQAAVSIGFTPSTAQVGQTPVLLEDITLTGTDIVTGGAIRQTEKNITTNILGDPGFAPADAIVTR